MERVIFHVHEIETLHDNSNLILLPIMHDTKDNVILQTLSL